MMVCRLCFGAAVLALCAGNRVVDAARTNVLARDALRNDVPSMRELAAAKIAEAIGGSALLESSRSGGPSANHTVYIGIISAPANEQKRQDIRNRWLTAARERYASEGAGEPRVRLEFIIGRLPILGGDTGRKQGVVATKGEMALEDRIGAESEKYADVYRIAAAESYAELPDKVLLMLGHALQGEYSFVVKVDDDQELDMDLLMSTVEAADPNDPLYSGVYLWEEATAPSQLGPGESFEKYYGGPCYLLSWSLVDRIARQHLSHSVSYNLYGTSSEDMDMGRWVGYEDKILSEEGGMPVEYRSLPYLSKAM